MSEVLRVAFFFCGPYFPVFGPNTEIFSVNIRFQSKHRKMRIIKNFKLGHFLGNTVVLEKLRMSAVNEKHPNFLTTSKCFQLFYFRK